MSDIEVVEVSQEGKDEETKYYLEYAKTGRGKCSVSKENFEKDELKVGRKTQHDEYGPTWCKIDPFFHREENRIRKGLQSISSLDDFIFKSKSNDESVAGSDALKDEDKVELQARIDKLVELSKEYEGKRKATIEKEDGSKKKRKIQAKKDETKKEDDVMSSFVISGVDWKKEAVKKIIEECKERNIKLPTDEKAAQMKILQQVMLHRNGESVDAAIVVNALKAELGAAKAVKEQAVPQVKCEKNRALVEVFSELGGYEFKVLPYKGIAYKKAAQSLAELDFEVTSGHELSKGKSKVPGIGKSLAEKIDEFLHTGSIAKLEEFRNT
uniref:PARP-type domain-containing protein n=1 Tax=Timspurckia oligopyrenoides TaxID=708627 RepID=A0A7S0ZET9_9RHOD|mmetsp:Transcript_2389/g.4188  ORF Transcript_2389/g.4188 Transcript_2389/m.4188 type:complete len:326 (+) Transcript_2389:54-1031(+)|eukprot:CAMPEP_0182451186 /NCGR_PEP_ID=MMETSP1172-20130603/43581_1 /TAXON_ID=708627 /ORGANISM="Timspurckia oligopyrenoides, Strain CCMP3278" /LENGTH=325 /DNA_ID=CAMNT_0024648937 /DNA_START=57 /DNA_END=1034 /DNA_ORIENTATION=-